MAVNKRGGYNYINDKCNPPLPVDMGTAVLFANSLPGINNTVSQPFGWSEYESAYRPRYVPDPCPARRPCIDPCRPRGTARKNPPRQFVNAGRYPRSTICQLCNKAKCRCPIPPPWEECREKIVVYDPDSVRTLLVHGEVKNEHPFVLSNTDYYRIMNNAIVKDKEQKEADVAQALREKDMALERCRERADEMRLIDLHRLNDSISPEAREDSNEILCRAEKILKEDEPEVRTINKVILAAKVQAIREAQLQEKELIKCEQAEEQRRLDALMKQDQEHALIKDDDKEIEILEQKKKDLMASLKAQLDEHEAMTFYFKEMKEREGEEMKRLWEQYDMEEIQRKSLEREKKAKLGLELLENQMLAVERMRREKEIDKELDQKMVDWQKHKAAEEERLEQEHKLQKKMKELAVKQVLDTQKRTADSKALRDELRAKRHQEQQEREWRRREREDLIKRKSAMEDLKDNILNQIRTKQDWIVEQAAFDKALYDKIFNIQDVRMEEERQKQEERKMKNAQYKLDLREQIHRYQLEKIKEKKDYYIDGIKCRRELGARDVELRCFMDRKLEELRDTNMPDKYLKYIQKAVEEELKPEWQKKMSK
ncbi:cilia- and flagella-associated protein 45-like [Folsomia candida]|uniref:cilia- and flagella-associated protein 45-like n=1 Tax=Folsomia candida TaxID=158441 RepID=UPI000B8FCBEA|nr:cilia- and flagella-associated protein 45-like [Folsomia candida]